MRTTDNTDIHAALTFLDSTDREMWIRIGMAVKSALGEAGFPLWCGWSQRASNYNERAAIATWGSFSDGAITIATLFSEARKAGWRPGVSSAPSFSPATIKAAREHQKKKSPEQAARTAQNMLSKAKYREHPYLVSKGFPALGMWVLVDTLLAPLWPVDHLVNAPFITNLNAVNVQLISKTGDKLFLKGGRVSGCACQLGNRPCFTNRTLLVEGVATGLSVKGALFKLGMSFNSVLVCFSANNLIKVSQADCLKNHTVEVIGDNDTTGTGQNTAKKSGRPYWIPPEKGDANDFHQRHGITALAEEIRVFLHER